MTELHDAPDVDRPPVGDEQGPVDGPDGADAGATEARDPDPGAGSARDHVVAVLGRGLARIGGASWESAVTGLVVAACATFVLVTVHPGLILTENTPTGGDMGSHVWGPMYLMREVLPQWRLSGWSPDWYAGFPAFQFYMVVPMLAIVVLDVGVRSPLLALSLPAALVVVGSGWFVPRLHRWRWLLFGVGLALTLLVVPIPYGIAFKLVAVSGLVGLPVAAWALGRLAGAPFPVPPALALGSLFFIYNIEPTLNSGTGNIIGGNLTSTMAGEFSFSISLTLGVLYLGFLLRGLRTGRGRATTAVLLALCGLCHIIPAFYVLGATALALVIWPGRARLRWFLPIGPVAGLLAAFWVVPFATRHAYVNDMGWERVPHPNSDPSQGYWDYLAPHALWVPIGLAAVGLVVGIVFGRRLAYLLGALVVLSGLAFVHVPDGRLWNARILPLYYLALFLLAALGVAEVLRALAVLVSRDPRAPTPWVGVAAALPAVVFVVLFLGGPLATLPGISGVNEKGEATLFADSPIEMTRTYRNPGSFWARYNFRGLEGQEPVATGAGSDAAVPDGQGGWPEYRDMVATMGALGQDPDHGCGRAFWEFSRERLGSYGTTMAPMMLPYFTDGCIGSMEGLYFESSATTPYHFLTQCQLSQAGSCSQRDLAYSGFDLERGLDQLELMGVRYYMAVSDTAVTQAAQSDRLTEVAVSGPWHVYELDPEASQAVVGLAADPVVLEGVEPTQDSWLDPAAAWFQDPTRWNVPFTIEGPDDWPRVTLPEVGDEGDDGTPRRVGDRTLPDFPTEAVREAQVSDIEMGTDTISFAVDEPGTPVLVKASYFPNWEATGAEGPYRVSPNLMVVVPTDQQVTLHYGRTSVDWAGYLLTLLGLAGVVLLWRLGPVAIPEGWVERRRRRRDEAREDARREADARARAEEWLDAPAGERATAPVDGPTGPAPPVGDAPVPWAGSVVDPTHHDAAPPRDPALDGTSADGPPDDDPRTGEAPAPALRLHRGDLHPGRRRGAGPAGPGRGAHRGRGRRGRAHRRGRGQLLPAPPDHLRRGPVGALGAAPGGLRPHRPGRRCGRRGRAPRPGRGDRLAVRPGAGGSQAPRHRAGVGRPLRRLPVGPVRGGPGPAGRARPPAPGARRPAPVGGGAGLPGAGPHRRGGRRASAPSWPPSRRATTCRWWWSMTARATARPRRPGPPGPTRSSSSRRTGARGRRCGPACWWPTAAPSPSPTPTSPTRRPRSPTWPSRWSPGGTSWSAAGSTPTPRPSCGPGGCASWVGG